MTRRTIGSVMDDINEWQGPNGTVYYVTAFTTNNEMISVGKKDMDAALEVRGLLQEVIEVPQEFILEPKGQTKKGNPKWNLKAFGPPEGVWTYNTIKGAAPDVREDGSGHSPPQSGVTPAGEIGRSPGLNVDASIRASVALKAAASSYSYRDIGPNTILERAEVFDQWLAKKASGEILPTPEEKDEGAEVEGKDPAPSSTTDGLHHATHDDPKRTPPSWTERVKDWPDNP